MADVLPFAGTRYNTKDHPTKIENVVAPPFDVIGPVLQKELHDKDAANIVRLDMGFETPSDDAQNNRYSRAAECYREWKAKGILADEPRKCFYIYEQEFKHPLTRTKVRRRGFFALVKLQDYRSGKIRSHELTFESPKIDRQRLLRTCQVNLSPPFVLYNDPQKEVEKHLLEAMQGGKPNEEFTDSTGTTHRLWLMHRKEPILAIHEAMKAKRLIIADGHHRYEAALAYRDEMREMTGRRDGRQPFDFTLMYLHRLEDEGLIILPVHRVLAKELGIETDIDEVLEDLGDYFTVKEFKVDMKNPAKGAATIEEKLAPTKQAKTRFVMALPTGRAWVLSLQKDADIDAMIDDEGISTQTKSLDVTILHRYVIAQAWVGNPEVTLAEDDVAYPHKIEDGLNLLKNRKGCAAFFVNPPSKEDVETVATNGELMPHNATYFYPKLMSGLVLRDLNVGFG